MQTQPSSRGSHDGFDSFHSEELHHLSKGSALLSHRRAAAVGYTQGERKMFLGESD